ncbi:MFS transporter [Deinococcus metallilatus]|uniref:MFS transporter n=1 Tax=Deinococcus metallilatus TaxID=1211322 RepID=UPI001FD32A63|nr:MFS transporter [Deinococcus metallilatus]
MRDGTARLWRDAPVRFALLMELVAAVAGALILVVTVVRVQGGLNLGEAQYGWVMALYGLGATVASLAVGAAGRRVPRTTFILAGALLTSLAILPGDVVGLAPLMILWLVAGVGQNWVNLPTETLLAERTEEAAQGRVYGAHFAWSHLWWAFSYPVASLLSARLPDHAFLYGGLLALVILAAVSLLSRGTPSPAAKPSSSTD